MLEEIQALLPLLENIADGALWAFIVYVLYSIFTSLIWPVLLFTVLMFAVPKVLRLFSDEPENVDLYYLENKGVGFVYYMGNLETINNLFKTISYTGKSINEWDVKEAIKKLEKAK